MNQPICHWRMSSDARLEKILTDYTVGGAAQHIEWQANSGSSQYDELRQVMRAASDASDEAGCGRVVVPRGDAGRIVFGARHVEIPVFAFAPTARVEGGLRHTPNVYAHVKAAMCYERAVYQEPPDARVTFVHAFSLGGLVASVAVRSVPLVCATSACFLAAKMLRSIIVEHNAMMWWIAPNRAFHQYVASYLFNAATYHKRCRHYWQYFKTGNAFADFTRLVDAAK